MKNLMVFGLFAVVFCASLSKANNWYDRGNGGFGLFCANYETTTLDIYEAANRLVLPVHYSTKVDSLEKAKDIVSRLKLIDPAREARYQEWLAAFAQETLFIEDTQFAPVPDLGLVTVPPKCELKQVVFQRNPSILNRARYLVNKNLWAIMDENQKAALIVHEIIYRDVINGNSFETSSERVRQFNAFLHSGQPALLNLTDYIQLLQELHFSTYEYRGLSFLLGYSDEALNFNKVPVRLYNGKILSGTLSAKNTVRPYFNFVCEGHGKDPRFAVANLSEDGHLENLELTPFWQANSDCYPSFWYQPGFEIKGSLWSFDSDERPVTVSGPSSVYSNEKLKWDSLVIEKRAGVSDKTKATESYFEFDESLTLRRVGLGGYPCLSKDKHIVFYPGTDYQERSIAFDSEGKLETELPLCY